MERGGQLRATGATRMNDTSSRSHAVFIIIVEQVTQCQICRTYVPPKLESVLRRRNPVSRRKYLFTNSLFLATAAQLEYQLAISRPST